jgi:non-specific serine/threonine protein kinase/serine/threonine-protein kinase
MTVPREDWLRAREIFEQAICLPESARTPYVVGACEGALRAEVEGLLASFVRAPDFLETPATMAAALTTCGPWRILREIGQGGMGAVYLVERGDATFTQRAALKFARFGFGGQVLQQRLAAERRILATLDHPNIARFIDGGSTAAGLPYVVMEYVEGVPIDRFCESRRLDVRQRVTLFRDVCAAVHYAHQRLIVHRDLKASNILVTADGSPKLLDFGIAKLLDPDAVADATRTLMRMATPDSASPEQLKGEVITTASDVYALGVLLYRLLTGRSPYTLSSDTDAELMRAVCDQVPPAPSAVRPAIDRDLDRIVLKALRKEPDRRYGTADQLSADLARYLDGRPVEAAPDTRGYRVRKFLRRHRVGIAATAALTIAVAGGVAATVWQGRVAQRERRRAEREFNAVRSLANSMLGEQFDATMTTEGRALLAKRATEYLDTLAADSAGDAELRREIARGYLRLGEVQGVRGGANLGDTPASLRSFQRAASLLEPLMPLGLARDRIALANVYARLGLQTEDRAAAAGRFQSARELLEGLAPADRSSADALGITALVWYCIAGAQVNAKDYAAAKISYQQEIAASESLFHLTPSRMSSRNLSIAYKQLGAIEQVLSPKSDDALTLYAKALALETPRLSGAGDTEARLDASFSHASIASVLFSRDDFDGALREQGLAIDLRRQAAAIDPSNDFAQTTLARSYIRMAQILSATHKGDAAIVMQANRVDVLRNRLKLHPERDGVWNDLAAGLFDAIGFGLDVLDPAAQRPGMVFTNATPQRVGAMFTELDELRARWAHAGRKGTLPPSDADLGKARARLQSLPAAEPK